MPGPDVAVLVPEWTVGRRAQEARDHMESICLNGVPIGRLRDVDAFALPLFDRADEGTVAEQEKAPAVRYLRGLGDLAAPYTVALLERADDASPEAAGERPSARQRG